jgi:cytochrome c oxidase assembly protein subunit 23
MARDDDSSMRPDEKVMEGKTASKFTDPCKKAAALSMKCLEDNSYDRGKCTFAFNN